MGFRFPARATCLAHCNIFSDYPENTPLQDIYFPNDFFALLRASLAPMFTYCRYKFIVAKEITLHLSSRQFLCIELIV